MVRLDRAVIFVGSLRLAAYDVDGNVAHLKEELPGDRFELCQDSGGFAKPCAARNVLQMTGEVAGHGRKLREHAAAFVSRFTQAQRVLATQRVPQPSKMLRDARGERLTHFPEQGRVPPAGSQQPR